MTRLGVFCFMEDVMACDTNQFKIGYQHYQPDPSDLCTLCGGNFGKSAMIECKDGIHICMDCTELLSSIKKERDDAKRDSAQKAIANALFNDGDMDTAESLRLATFVYGAISRNEIPGICIE